MNLCPVDNRPVQVVLDLDRLQAEQGPDGWWNPARRDLWRFGGLLPLDVNDPDDRRHVVTLRRRATRRASLTSIPLADGSGCRLEVKDEGKPYPRLRRQPDALVQGPGDGDDGLDGPALGLTRLAVPTQGNAGDALAEYAVAGGIRGRRS